MYAGIRFPEDGDFTVGIFSVIRGAHVMGINPGLKAGVSDKL